MYLDEIEVAIEESDKRVVFVCGDVVQAAHADRLHGNSNLQETIFFPFTDNTFTQTERQVEVRALALRLIAGARTPDVPIGTSTTTVTPTTAVPCGTSTTTVTLTVTHRAKSQRHGC